MEHVICTYLSRQKLKTVFSKSCKVVEDNCVAFSSFSSFWVLACRKSTDGGGANSQERVKGNDFRKNSTTARRATYTNSRVLCVRARGEKKDNVF